MPVISRFYGISIKMYFNDHLPAHFHAIYGEFVGLYDLNKLELKNTRMNCFEYGTRKSFTV